MDRRALKDAARQDVDAAAYSPRRVTLIFLLVVAALAALEIAVNLWVEGLGSGGTHLSDTVSAGGRNYLTVLLLSLFCQAIFTLLTAGYTAFALKLRSREEFSLQILWSGFYRAVPVLLLYLLKSVLLALWVSVLSIPVSYVLSAMLLSGTLTEQTLYLVMLGSMLFLMFLMSYRYRMAFFMLMDDPALSPRQALNQAKAINKIHRFRLFLLDVSFLPWIILSILSCGILLIWKLPYMIATYAHAYHFMLEDYARRQENLRAFFEQMHQNPPR